MQACSTNLAVQTPVYPVDQAVRKQQEQDGRAGQEAPPAVLLQGAVVVEPRIAAYFSHKQQRGKKAHARDGQQRCLDL